VWGSEFTTKAAALNGRLRHPPRRHSRRLCLRRRQYRPDDLRLPPRLRLRRRRGVQLALPRRRVRLLLSRRWG
jgi:hypothetical protein